MSPEISKPEWFQMAEADAIKPKPNHRRHIRMLALATPLLVLGAGLAYAQTQSTDPASAGTPVAVAATSTIAPTSAPAATPTTSAPVSTSSEASYVAPAVASKVEHSAAATVVSTPSAIQVSQTSSTPPTTITKPGLTMPTGGGEDSERSSDDD